MYVESIAQDEVRNISSVRSKVCSLQDSNAHSYGNPEVLNDNIITVLK